VVLLLSLVLVLLLVKPQLRDIKNNMVLLIQQLLAFQLSQHLKE